MASLNPLTRELVFKIVFYGPGLGGKTTTLQYIHAATKPEHRGKMVSLATPMDRTLYFDFLPLRVPRVRGMSVRLQLFTVPGQVYYGATRKLVLTGADGIVFVADSQAGRGDSNQESLEDLITNLADHNRGLAALPHTFHWNKRDIPDVAPIEELDRKFNPEGAPSLGTVATRGAGVFEGLERITRLVMRAYEAELPKNDASPGLVRSDSEDVGITDAIRGLTESPYMRVTPFAGIRAVRGESGGPSSLEAIPSPIPRRLPSSPDLSAFLAASAPLPESHDDHASTDGRLIGLATLPPVPDLGGAAEPRPGYTEATEVSVRDTDANAPRSRQGPDASSSKALAATEESPHEVLRFSFAALWGDGERETVRDVESDIAAGNFQGAVLACDVLVTRVLASAAGLAGNVDAPRDPSVVALLLGLEGRRYLAFRAIVRAGRLGEGVTARDALDAYALAIEARRARGTIDR
jgi:signal recognition particle receptor subunit beta